MGHSNNSNSSCSTKARSLNPIWRSGWLLLVISDNFRPRRAWGLGVLDLYNCNPQMFALSFGRRFRRKSKVGCTAAHCAAAAPPSANGRRRPVQNGPCASSASGPMPAWCAYSHRSQCGSSSTLPCCSIRAGRAQPVDSHVRVGSETTRQPRLTVE